jgi:DnaJ-class molecular chaperone
MKTTNKYITQVIACPDCCGAGKVLIDPGELYKYYEKKTCETCSGSGRLIRKTTIEFEPYIDNDKNLVKI